MSTLHRALLGKAKILNKTVDEGKLPYIRKRKLP